MRTLIITDKHSSHNPEQRFEVSFDGGDPYFTCIWINDECYTISYYDTDEGQSDIALKKV